MKVSELGEFGLLESLGLSRTKLPEGWTGPGDDCALIPGAGDLAISADLLVEGVHFKTGWARPQELGYKSLAVNLSDLASVGATPIAFTITLSLPGHTPVEWVKDLYEGLNKAAEEFGCPLVGGDLSKSSCIQISITIFGRQNPSGSALRSGAMPGQNLYVTGNPGESAAGLEILRREIAERDGSMQKMVDRHNLPTPRMDFGYELTKDRIAGAMIDVSDGVLQDAGHIAMRSCVQVVIDADALSFSPDFLSACQTLGLDPRTLALTGGEDYELCFTANPEDHDRIMRRAKKMGVWLSLVGYTRKGEGILVVDKNGEPVILRQSGHDHFS